MKHSFTCLLSFLLLFSACNIDPDRRLSGDELAALAKAGADTVVVQIGAESTHQGILDSFARIPIHVPPLYDKAGFDSATTASFFSLARATGGDVSLLVNSKLLSGEIAHIISTCAKDGGDLLLLMDKTGSMTDDIDNVRAGLGQILRALRKHKDIRLAVALYGDKNVDKEEPWFSFQNFETDYGAAQSFVDSIKVTGGGDLPESVYDGFFEACKSNFWRSGRQRMVILIGDAPPLEKPLSDYTLGDVIAMAGSTGTRMNFYPIVVTPASYYNDDTAAVPGMIPVKFAADKLITTLYPNPASGDIHVDFAVEDEYSIELFGSSGARIYSEHFTGSRWSHDVSGLSNGTYLLRTSTRERTFETKKFVVYR